MWAGSELGAAAGRGLPGRALSLSLSVFLAGRDDMGWMQEDGGRRGAPAWLDVEEDQDR